MRHQPLFTLLCLACFCLVSFTAPIPIKSLRVVTTTPELAWFVQQIGGDQVSVDSLAKGRENMHSLTVKPRTIVSISRADLLFENGLSLEATWLPELLLAARNKDLTFESGARVNCSEGWQPIQVPTDLSRKNGDVHSGGNPHFALSPTAGTHIAKQVLEGLVQAAPDSALVFRANHKRLQAELDQAAKRWARYIPLFKGKQAAVYHQEFDYLLDFLAIEVAASIEPNPGLPPTPKHLAGVLQTIQNQQIPAVLVAPWSHNRQAKSIAQKSGAKLIEMPTMVGGAAYATGWITWIDGMLEQLRGAYDLAKPAPLEEPSK